VQRKRDPSVAQEPARSPACFFSSDAPKGSVGQLMRRLQKTRAGPETCVQPNDAEPSSSVEGDGWVNWSGLATGLQEFGNQLALRLKRLLSGLANQEQRPATSPTAEETLLSVPSGV
jgi:hypothetical protein